MDNFNTLWNRLLSRAPLIGPALSQQLINDAWRQLQSKREWSWRRRHGTLAPPNLYQTGTATTHVADGTPQRIIGTGTAWTPDMVGRQIRIGGLLNPYYTITNWISATEVYIDQPWAGPEAVNSTYQILQIYYPMPEDFQDFYAIWSVKDAYRLWTNVTEDELAVLDPQRANQGQTYAAVFYGYQNNYQGIVGPAQQAVGSGSGPTATTTDGYSYPANQTYVVTITNGGMLANATWTWKVLGGTASADQTMSGLPQDLSNGVQIYWPVDGVFVTGDTWVIQCQALASSGNILTELWPSPVFSPYVYPYIYFARPMDLTAARPQLPVPIASRGDVLLEMALAACARWPGNSNDNPNPYFSLALAKMHEARVFDLMIDLEREDESTGISLITYKDMDMAPAPWMTGSWQQSHAPIWG